MVDKNNNENNDLKKILWPVLPHVPVEIRAPILKNLCHSHKNQGKAGNHNDNIQDAENPRSLSNLPLKIFKMLLNVFFYSCCSNIKSSKLIVIRY